MVNENRLWFHLTLQEIPNVPRLECLELSRRGVSNEQVKILAVKFCILEVVLVIFCLDHPLETEVIRGVLNQLFGPLIEHAEVNVLAAELRELDTLLEYPSQPLVVSNSLSFRILLFIFHINYNSRYGYVIAY